MTTTVTTNSQKEVCPVCLMILTARFAAHSHYLAHVRAGELDARGRGDEMEFCLANPTSAALGSWWRRGFKRVRMDMSLERERDLYLVRLHQHQGDPPSVTACPERAFLERAMHSLRAGGHQGKPPTWWENTRYYMGKALDYHIEHCAICSNENEEI